MYLRKTTYIGTLLNKKIIREIVLFLDVTNFGFKIL